MSRIRALEFGWIAGFVLVLATSCGQDRSSDDPFEVRADTEDGSQQADTGVESDTGSADTGSEDLDADGETDRDGDGDVEVIRRVVERDLFGELPVDNHFLDPGFRGATSWIPFEIQNGNPAGYSEAYREVYAQTPKSAPVFRIPAAGSSTSIRVAGRVMLRQQPFEISVWLGRSDEFDGTIDVTVVGVEADDPSTLNRVNVPGDESEQREMGGIQWREFSTEVTGFFGPGYLLVEGTVGEALYVHAPVATEAESMTTGLTQFATPEIEQATDLDRASVRVAREWSRLHRPDPKEFLTGPSLDYLPPEFR